MDCAMVLHPETHQTQDSESSVINGSYSFLFISHRVDYSYYFAYLQVGTIPKVTVTRGGGAQLPFNSNSISNTMEYQTYHISTDVMNVYFLTLPSMVKSSRDTTLLDITNL